MKTGLHGIGHTSSQVAVRLYRPGYDLVEIRAREPADGVIWKAAPDLASQERAVDALFSAGTVAAGLTREADPEELLFDALVVLEPGSTSDEHRDALLFGAAEYDRLAASVQGRDSDALNAHTRLYKKAVALRTRAEQ
jgi:hypothetical protein